MKRQKKVLALGLSGLCAITLSVMVALPAGADYAPQAGDVVGVGGDTPQYALTFLANGDAEADAGFNSAGAYNRLVVFNATADANGRSAYANGSTEASPKPLNPTDVLRAGTNPVQRVQSSGAAISALLADTGAQETINFVFSASLPTVTQQKTATTTRHWGGLHVVEIGTDSVNIATATTTNAPAGLTITTLLKIYTGTITKWNQIPGNSSGSTHTIIPEIPPTTSSIYKTFLASLKTANHTVTPTLTGTVTVEQNDPTSITGATSPADAIVPFSAARLALYNSSYFHTPNTVFPGGAAINANIKFDTGTGAYTSPVTDYVIFRQKDLASKTPFEPGASANWVQALFSGSTAYAASPAGQALIDASGVTAHYADLGVVHS